MVNITRLISLNCKLNNKFYANARTAIFNQPFRSLKQVSTQENTKALYTSDDGSIEYVVLSNDRIDDSMEVVRKAYFVNENVCRAVELQKHPKALKEVEQLFLGVIKDGVSLVAVEKKSQKVIGIIFNKIQILDLPFFENYSASFKEPSSLAFMNFMEGVDAQYDFFKQKNVDCLFEIMFAATLREYRGMGIGADLTHLSINLAKSLSARENIKTPVSSYDLKLNPIPKIMTSISTTPTAEKVLKSYGFKIDAIIPFDNFTFNGKTFRERLGPEIPLTIRALHYRL